MRLVSCELSIISANVCFLPVFCQFFRPVDIDGEKEAAIIATSFGVSGTLEGDFFFEEISTADEINSI